MVSYVQTSTAPIVKIETNETPKHIIPKRKSIHNYSANSSYDRNSSIHTSTPKRRLYKSSNSDISFNESHDSPFKSRSNHSFEIRPHTLENYFTEQLFSNSKENILNTKKKKNKSRNSQSPKLNNSLPIGSITDSETQQTHDLNCSEPIRNIKNVNNRVRRIKPTILLDQSPKIVSSNSFSFTENTHTAENDVTNWHRNILREERERIAAKTADILISATRNQSTTSTGQNIQANPLLVTKINTLTRLAEFYSLLLDLGLLLSPVSELHLLLTLLLSNTQSDEKPKILDSLHNCVWLATQVLWHQRDIILSLNRMTLRLLSENQRIQDFVPNLSVLIIEQMTVTERKRSDSATTVQDQFAPKQATFLSENDSRYNFSNDISFHTFRKQRDAFYSILQIWEQNHNKPGWLFLSSLGSRICNTLEMHNDPVNYCHLARLFVNQLLSSINQTDIDKDINHLDVSTDKLTKLKNRLINKETPDTQEQTDFPHQQEFYREFINCSRGNHVFIKYLQNTLADIIVTTEDNFYQEDADGALDNVSQDYVKFLKTTRLLAKFLGYTEALPYKTEIPTKENVLKTVLTVRRLVSLHILKNFIFYISKNCVLGITNYKS